ncbi:MULTISPECIES: single-stranded DNA-binding protein [Morganellaceae]|uniref:single-stranded DNA-binding protein n=1 Tax=Morganellaceae TaxID=1903414 RepID=UPI0018E4CADD|nr:MULTISPECIES: single-stranded DNA-binding protein [Morganellaceae]MBI6530056.1 single-stranded DNA-binding protein [Proteus vulgaris]MBP6082218.1 single-stranded DNA-binding protein [Providencia sp.]
MELLNKVQLIARLGTTPKDNLKYSERDGEAMTYFSVAINRHDSKGNSIADWFNISAYGKIAEIAANFGQKGQLVYIEGRLQPNNNSTGSNGCSIIMNYHTGVFRVLPISKNSNAGAQNG